jgi:glycosyltransferase involved in cell wall biosynthesis
MNKKKVLHLINGEFYAGAEKVQDVLACCLPSHGWDVEFFQLKPGIFQSGRKNCSVIHQAFMRSRFDFRPALQLHSLIESGDFSLVHSHTTRSLLLAACVCLFNRIPLVHHCHSSEVISSKEGLVDWINRKLESVLLRFLPDKVIAVSKGALSYLRSVSVPEGKIVYIPNGVPVTGLVSQPVAEGEVFEFICVALFRQRKGVEVLLEAFAQLLKTRNNKLRLSLVGNFETPEYRNQIEHHVQSLGIRDSVVFEGFCGDVPARLAKSQTLVFPSVRAEGMPMVLLEAMSVGLPIIASDVEGVADLVKNEVNGVLVEPSSIAALALVMNDFLNGAGSELIKRYGEEGRKIQQDCFSDDSMARDLAGVYSELIGKGA